MLAVTTAIAQPEALSVDGVAHRAATVGGYRIHYAEAGDGEPLVLLHGWPQHWYEWRHVIAPLAERYRVIVPDIRGLGWSEGPGSSASIEHYTLLALAGDLVGLLNALGIERTRYVGHDWGCLIGYRALLSTPRPVSPRVPDGGSPPVGVVLAAARVSPAVAHLCVRGAGSASHDAVRRRRALSEHMAPPRGVQGRRRGDLRRAHQHAGGNRRDPRVRPKCRSQRDPPLPAPPPLAAPAGTRAAHQRP